MDKKTLIIGIITVAALAVLLLLVFFSGVFAGKAAYTLADGKGGFIEADRPEVDTQIMNTIAVATSFGGNVYAMEPNIENDLNCGDINCQVGEQCQDGTCYPVSCDTQVCPGIGEVCLEEGCPELSCEGVTCPEGHYCASGYCYPTECEGQFCPGWGVVCLMDGEGCPELSCEGVTCPMSQECHQGYCYPTDPETEEVDTCMRVQCPRNKVCVEGKCYSTEVCELGCVDPSVCE